MPSPLHPALSTPKRQPPRYLRHLHIKFLARARGAQAAAFLGGDDSRGDNTGGNGWAAALAS